MYIQCNTDYLEDTMPELVLDWNKYQEAAIKAASEGIVMLKNAGNALPLKHGSRVALFGRMQANYYKSGTGSGGMVNVNHVVDIREGLASSPSVTLDPELMDIYDDWEKENPLDGELGWGMEAWSQTEMPISAELAGRMAARNDAAVIIIARTAGEDRDNSATKGSFYLRDSEEAMLASVSAAFSRTIVLLNVGNLIDMSFVSKYDIKSVLYVWQGGMIGGTAVARIVTGEESPSGCLTDTIAESLADYPSNDNFGNKDIHEDLYEEDIFVGYRYFSTFAPSKVLYPFGYGLSYTTFSTKVSSFCFDGKEVKVSVIVENTGSVPGKKAVMLYASAPQGRLSKPSRVLTGFAKTGKIPSGGSETVEITAPVRAFASFDDDGRTGVGTGFILDAGHYAFYLGGDVTSSDVAGSFELDAPVLVEALENAMVTGKAFKRLIAVPSASGNVFEKGYEDVPLMSVSHLDTRMSRVPSEIKQTGDRGIKLADVRQGKNTLEEFIAQLSDEELCLIIRGEGMGSSKATIGTAAAFGGISKELKAMGIPTLCCSDGPSGMRIDSGKKAFSLPNGTCLASTFNTELVEELYTYLGIEMVSNKIDTLLGPGINIHRHPLNGRNFEYFSEDPLLTGHMACAQIRALEKNGVTPTIKHFCGNNRENGRREMSSVISERALREIYLTAFEIAVKEGGARSIMSSYNRVNGVYAANYYDMNTVVLREQWGYTGIVMTDWWAYIGVTGGDTAEYTITDHSVMARAQNDIYMVCTNVERKNIGETDAFKELTEGDGSRITRAELQRNAANILRFAMNTPAMDRVCGNPATVTHIDNPFKEDNIYVDVDMFFEVDDELVIDRPENTWTDKDFIFGIASKKQGYYELEMTGSSELNSLAQIPMQMYLSSIPFAVVTWNGTEGADVALKQQVVLLSRDGVMRLHFSQPGVKLKKIVIRYLRPVKPDDEL